MKTHTRDQCIICKSSQLEHLYTYEKFPIYMGISDDTELYEDQVWGICSECQCIQLLELLDPDILYKTPHNPAIGKMWETHNKSYANFISSVCTEDDAILEIGGGNCRLAKEILENKNIKYTIYDQHQYEIGLDVKFVDNFYIPETYKKNEDYNVIISSHWIEHVYNLHDYIKSFSDNLDDGGLVIFSLPHITNMVQSNMPNGLNFEHTYQCDPYYIQKVMNQYGFYLEKIEHFNDYNDFMVFRKQANVNVVNLKPPQSKDIFDGFIKYHQANSISLKEQVKHYKNKFLFGCHVFSQYLLYFGLNEDDFVGIIDNDPNKIGHKLYGSKLVTYPSSVVKDLDDVTVIVQAGIYTKEITDYLLSFNQECHIVT